MRLLQALRLVLGSYAGAWSIRANRRYYSPPAPKPPTEKPTLTVWPLLNAYGLGVATGFGMRNVYTTPNTMVVPFGWASALYSFSYLKNTFQACARSM
jgi:hypothetical protein